MRTNMKKMISMLLTLIVVFAYGGMLTAATTYTIKIKKSNPSDSYTHNVAVYQVFTADVQTSGTEKKLYNIDWASNVDSTAAMTAVTALTDFSSCTTVADIVAVLAAKPSLVDAFAEAVSTHLGTSPATATIGTSETSKEITVDDTGYYLVMDTIKDGSKTVAESKFMLDVVKDTEILEIATKEVVPSLDKKIIEDGTSKSVNAADVGELITFQITSKVPNLTDKGYNKYCYVVTDTLCKGLTYNGSNAPEVKINGVATTDFTFTKSVDSSTGVTTLKIVFKDFLKTGTDVNLIGKDIVITYQGYLNENADLTSAGNPNTAKLIYSNDPAHDYTGDEPEAGEPYGETPDVQTVTYTTGIQIVKVDKNDNSKLSGAVFKIEGTAAEQVIKTSYQFTKSGTGTYYRLKNGTYTTTAPTQGTADQYESTTDKYELSGPTSALITKDANSVVKAEVDSDGVLHLDGLGAGKYTITEIQAPDGYVPDSTPHVLEIACTFDAQNKPQWTYEIDDVPYTGPVLMTVQNEKTSDLPSTGGIGAEVYYVSGSVLLLAGAALFIAKKRKTAEN